LTKTTIYYKIPHKEINVINIIQSGDISYKY